MATPDQPKQPYLTFTTTEHIFEYITQKRGENALRPLQILKLHCGDDIRCGGWGFPAPEAFWPTYNSISFICELSARDDAAAAGVFTVICPRLRSRAAIDQRASGVSTQSPARAMLSKLRSRGTLLGRLMGHSASSAMISESQRDSSPTEIERVACQGPRPKVDWHAHY